MLNRRRILKYGVVAPFTSVTAVPGVVSAAQLRRVVRCAIYPPVGFARVGNSTEGYVLAPEVPGLFPPPAKGYKDSTGRIYPQAVRFRVYGFDANDRVVGELDASVAKIQWNAHVVNRKAAWYNFNQAFDIPESADLKCSLRNKEFKGSERSKLVIDPGPRKIQGRNVNAHGNQKEYQFSGGEFCGIPVNLGTLRTDPQGRLIVTGGQGQSGSMTPEIPAYTFANNDNWYDDTSDGPVDATVTFNGQTMQAEGAWVVTAPPNFAPGIQGVVTLYDVMYEVGMSMGIEPPARPSFTRQIMPLLQRVVQYQWVNKGVLQLYGWATPGNFMKPGTLLRLANPSPRFKALRESVFKQFRNPDFATYEPDKLPPCYGDNTNLPPTSPRQFQAVLANQYAWLQQWAEGDFVADLPSNLNLPQWPENLSQLPISDQPEALNRASLDNCLGGPFHPGCELTWPVRNELLYDAPFRIARRNGPEPDFGPVLTQPIALSDTGPLNGSRPGDLTRWMAVPWQSDTSSCLYAYGEPEDVYLPTFWPARVPNNVLTSQDFAIIQNRRLPLPMRVAAFHRRADWFRLKPANGAQQMLMVNHFIKNWSRIGIVSLRPGPGDDSNFPNQFWVEGEASFQPL